MVFERKDVTRSEIVRFDVEAYSFDAIQRAAYRFCDRISVEVTRDDASWLCAVFPAAATDFSDEDVAAFRIECLDQTLRERIRIETEAVRNLILAHAFAGLVEQPPS